MKCKHCQCPIAAPASVKSGYCHPCEIAGVPALMRELDRLRSELAECEKRYEHQASRSERWRDEAKEAQQDRDSWRDLAARLAARLDTFGDMAKEDRAALAAFEAKKG